MDESWQSMGWFKSQYKHCLGDIRESNVEVVLEID